MDVQVLSTNPILEQPSNMEDEFPPLFVSHSKSKSAPNSPRPIPEFIPPYIKPKSFTAVLAQPSIDSHTPTLFSDYSTPGIGTVLYEEDKEILNFSEVESNNLAKKWDLALVGKFSQGLPDMNSMRVFFDSLKMLGSVDIRILNLRHVLFKFSHASDLAKVWLRPVWHINSYTMRMFKWSPSFSVRKESSIIPVWLKLPGLPIHLFDKDALFSIANLIGQPIQIDKATAALTKLSFARICVGLDVSIPPKEFITLKIGNDIREQKVVYEKIPKFCQGCFHAGHDISQCYTIGNAPRPSTVSHEGVLDSPSKQPQSPNVVLASSSMPNNSQSIQPIIERHIPIEPPVESPKQMEHISPAEEVWSQRPGKKPIEVDSVPETVTTPNRLRLIQEESINLPPSDCFHQTHQEPDPPPFLPCEGGPVNKNMPDSASSLIPVLRLEEDKSQKQIALHRRASSVSPSGNSKVPIKPLRPQRNKSKVLDLAFSSPIFHCTLNASFVYAESTRTERRSLWDDLRESAATYINIPCQMVSDCGISDAGFEGNMHTWARNGLLERLDRVFVNTQLPGLFPKFCVKHLARVKSDHAPLLLSASLSRNKPPAAFRYFKMWARYSSFIDTVSQNLNKAEDKVLATEHLFDTNPTPTNRLL
ncbi:hypothetical protein DH2020_004876 [Rehmannia glutinosa]|uniref:DUF4283 domain-containing protein n=1 Tax=Rehmannia glutinosa TaxID=99300 RepID=A0ABR0XR26_REHGL